MAAYLRSQLVLLRSPGQRHLLSYRSSSSSAAPSTITPPPAPAGGRTSSKGSPKYWIYGPPGLASSMLSLMVLLTPSSSDVPAADGAVITGHVPYEPPLQNAT
ncbi:hypothetical protein CFC21_069013 [Triticum aestivum]|uniref:Uncharacterized protein n=4 Tax=Triticum TaxID=4564 RepID=A0A9R0U471_TRITD|nr:hypothetical protein TRIUR3_02104 [Triticum urartu]KAF7062405.1 hypothetical protein CFC21_069013 [Triticum aestivum]VAI25203.1 unnamed protein product [Triticum turgidum subsp. durum]